MRNKYLYALRKDAAFRAGFVFSVFGAAVCAVLLRLDARQALELKGICDKQAAIAQIPALRAKIAAMGAVNGLVLNGIISGKTWPMAVINNTLVKVGGEIDGKKVAAIMDKSVTVCNIEAPDKCIQLLLQ